VRMGSLRRTTPLSNDWGWDRGTPIDRYYIERFLEAHTPDIRGHVLEVKDLMYTDRFGTDVISRDVLDIDAGNPLATIVADLSAASSVPGSTFDCFILTQTLQYIYDVRSAVAHARRILKPGGTLLATVPAIQALDDSNDYWRFTPAFCTALFGDVFGSDAISVETYGNVLSSIAYLVGMAYEELSNHELDVHDLRFTQLIAVRAVRG
jgi:SAM-dependent methyltransferase